MISLLNALKEYTKATYKKEPLKHDSHSRSFLL